MHLFCGCDASDPVPEHCFIVSPVTVLYRRFNCSVVLFVRVSWAEEVTVSGNGGMRSGYIVCKLTRPRLAVLVHPDVQNAV